MPPGKERDLHRFDLDPRSLSREEPIPLAGPAGALEALWRPPRPGRAPRGSVVMAHPHPLFGGTMQNKVVFHVARTLNHDLDLASLRFNFRGVGASAGAHDEGRGEVLDLLAAWAEAARRAEAERRAGPGLRVAAGFSFGAAMTLLAAETRGEAGESPPDALALVGIPARLIVPPEHVPPGIPLAVVHGESDQFTPPETVGRWLESWPGPSAFHVVRGADHFLEGHLPEAVRFLSDRLREWL